MNAVMCVKAIICALFCSRKVQLSQVESIYNENNNRSTIFGKEYENHLDQRKTEVLHNAINHHNNSTLKTIIISANELKELIDNQSFSNNIHYILEGDFTYRNDDIMDFVLPDYLTIIGNLNLSNNSNLTQIPEKITVTGSISFSGCSSITRYPESLNKINGSINLSNCTNLTKVPGTMVASMFINFAGCINLKFLPKKIITGTHLNCCYCINIDYPPESIHVGGHAIFHHCPKMRFLPAEIHIEGSLYTSTTATIPKEAHIGGMIYLNL